MSKVKVIGDNRLAWLKAKYLGKYPQPMWLQFTQLMMEMGLKVGVKWSESTRSKYVHVSLGAKKVTVRFGNHWPKKNNTANLYAGPAKNNQYIPTYKVVNSVIRAFNLREPMLKAMPPVEP